MDEKTVSTFSKADRAVITNDDQCITPAICQKSIAEMCEVFFSQIVFLLVFKGSYIFTCMCFIFDLTIMIINVGIVHD